MRDEFTAHTDPQPQPRHVEHKSVLGWVDKLMFGVFGALVIGLGAWNLHTAHENAIQIAEVRVEIVNLKDNKDIEHLREMIDSMDERLERIEDKF